MMLRCSRYIRPELGKPAISTRNNISTAAVLESATLHSGSETYKRVRELAIQCASGEPQWLRGAMVFSLIDATMSCASDKQYDDITYVSSESCSLVA
jgi:hypothetical protein